MAHTYKFDPDETEDTRRRRRQVVRDLIAANVISKRWPHMAEEERRAWSEDYANA